MEDVDVNLNAKLKKHIINLIKKDVDDWPKVKKGTGLLPPNKKGVIETGLWPNRLVKPFPAPATGCPKAIDYCLDNDGYGVFDPARQFPQLLNEIPKCPHCGKNDVKRNGLAERLLKVFHANGCIDYIIEVTYRCKECTVTESGFFSSLDTHVVRSYKNALKRKVGMMKVSSKSRYAVTDQMRDLIMSLKAAGLGFKAISDSLRSVSETEIYRRELRLQDAYDRTLHAPPNRETVFSYYQNQYQKDSRRALGSGRPFLSTEHIRQIFCSYACSQKPLQKEHIRRRVGTQLGVDLTFYGSKMVKGRRYAGIVTVKDEMGAILNTVFVKDKSQESVKPILEEIRLRAELAGEVITEITTDNPYQDETFLKKIFPQASVLVDIFHILQDFVKATKKKSKASIHTCKAITACFWKINPDDYKRHCEKLMQIKKCPNAAEFERRFKERPSRYGNYIRRSLRRADDIYKDVRKIINESTET